MSSGNASSAARGSGDAKTFSVWAARKRFRARRISGCLPPRIAAGEQRPRSSRPALPIASVPTGTPAGIWTIDSSESMPLERLRLDRNAEHGKRGLRRGHSRQMRRASGPCDQHLEPARLGRSRVFEQEIGCAMSRHDLHLMRNAEVLQRLCCGLERLPVRTRAHDQAPPTVSWADYR